MFRVGRRLNKVGIMRSWHYSSYEGVRIIIPLIDASLFMMQTRGLINSNTSDNNTGSISKRNLCGFWLSFVLVELHQTIRSDVRRFSVQRGHSLEAAFCYVFPGLCSVFFTQDEHDVFSKRQVTLLFHFPFEKVPVCGLVNIRYAVLSHFGIGSTSATPHG